MAAGAGSWFERREEISALGREFGIAGGEGTKQHQTLLIAGWVPLPRPRGRCVAGLAGGSAAPRARRAAEAGAPRVDPALPERALGGRRRPVLELKEFRRANLQR